MLYGAAEFSRDVDIAIATDAGDWAALRRALGALHAEPIAIPPPSLDALRRGHALHFRVCEGEATGIRVDVMAALRGVDCFESLWERRTTLMLADDVVCEVLSLPDLVAAKKTQRDKDWPMVRRLVEAHYAVRSGTDEPEVVDFWLTQARTPSILLEVCAEHPIRASRLAAQRPLLGAALAGDHAGVEEGLASEEAAERAADRAYWRPLRQELEEMRHSGVSRSTDGTPTA